MYIGSSRGARKVCQATVALIALALMNACAITDRLRVKPPPDIYVLTPIASSISVNPPAGSLDQVLLVNATEAAPGYDSVRIAYSREPPRLDYYQHSKWADLPGRMLEPILVAALEHSHQFAAVVTGGSGLHADLRLDTQILAMQHEVTTHPGQSRISLRAQLSNLRTARVIATKTFERSAVVTTGNARGAVEGINAALEQLVSDVVRFCAQTDTAAKPAPMQQ